MFFFFCHNHSCNYYPSINYYGIIWSSFHISFIMDKELTPQSTITLPSGNKIPIIGYGTYQLKENDCVQGVQYALKSGYIHIDTASIYKNQIQIRQAIQKTGIPREKLFITSKISPQQQGFDASKKAVSEIIQKLGCQYLDLILIHWPAATKLKPDDPKNCQMRHETWRAFMQMQKQGKVKDIGVSNFLKNHLQRLIKKFGVKPAVNQFEIHPCLWQGPTINFCRQNNIAIQAYSPLARQADELFKSKKMNLIAEKHKKSVAQVSLRWCIQNGFIILPKSKSENRIQQNMNIFDFKLDGEDMKLISDLQKKKKRTCWNPNVVRY